MLSEKCIMQKMGGLALGLILTLLLCHCVDARRVDCTKFVFAPICRGVAAKRAAAGGLSSFFPEGREQAPVDRLSSMMALTDDPEFPQGAELLALNDDLSTSRRLSSEGGKSGDAPLVDPFHDFLRTRWNALRDAIQRHDGEREGLSDEYTADILGGKFQKAYRQRRAVRRF